ncbi:MAG: hypothetical protein AB7F74_01855 [Parvibaculaceae bacterium]
MTSRMNRESKAQATHVAAMRIVEAEKAQQKLKIARLRQLRLTQQAKIDAAEKISEAK